MKIAKAMARQRTGKIREEAKLRQAMKQFQEHKKEEKEDSSMNGIINRIACLRNLMETYHMDAYFVPTADFHESEYVGEHFACRKYITGFTGSAGVALITKDWAGL